MANKVYESPGYYATEKDLTYSTEVVGVTTLGVVGETVKGPAMQPIFIKNYDDFQVVFGGTSPTKFKNTQIPKYELAYIAKAYLSQTNQLYVTRVLGLSGYDAGKAYALRTIGNVDFTGATATVTTYTIPFYADEDCIFRYDATTLLIDRLATLTGVATTEYDTAFNLFFVAPSGPWDTGTGSTNNGLYWGSLPTATQVAFDAATSGYTETDAYELPSDISAEDEEEYWLLHNFTYVPNPPTGDTYTGSAFALYVDPNTIAPCSGHTICGTATVWVANYVATPMLEYHNRTVATLRSRGYYVGQNQRMYVTGSTMMTETTDIVTDPLAVFHITGATTVTGITFDYTVNLNPNSNNYIKKVLGTTSTDKDTYLFVEECFSNVLTQGYDHGYIKGLNPVMAEVNTWYHYKFQYQSPMTEFFVSELRGGLPQRLFRFISISDGNSANTEIKISIANINLNTRKFDVYVRSFSDKDRQPNYLERFLGCNMDPASDDFIGRKIGTADNMFSLVSSYVMVDLDEKAPTDAVPAGFEGIPFRYATGVLSPRVSYKLKYYKAGDTVYTPPFGTPVISTGDKVKRVFLGYSDTVGIDSDMFQFKGYDPSGGNGEYNDGAIWGKRVRGFHMDKNAAAIVDSEGNQVFDVGEGQFTDIDAIAIDNTEPYYDIRTRKFTACLSGGFDGWDIYRDYRTNTDDYKIGRPYYTAGLEDGVFCAPFYIQGQDDEYGNSDYYAYLLGIQTMENPEEVNINILATPGIDLVGNTELVREAIEVVEEKRQDSIYLPTMPDMELRDNTTPSDSERWYYPTDAVEQLEATEIDSNYVAVFYPWYQIFDSENNTNLFVPATTDVVRNLALTDNIAHPWYATAGYKRGLVNAKRTRIKLTQDYRDTLYVGRINPIATFTDVGLVIWGNRNLQIANSALNRLNIRRLLLQCKKLIGQVGNRLLFDPNDDTIRNDFLAAVNPILDNIRKERGLIDFRVKLYPLADGDDRNTLRGKIYLKPTPALEVIDLEFVVTPTNVSFDNF